MAGLVLSIVGLVLAVVGNFLPYSFAFYLVGLIASIVGLVLSVKAGKVNKTGATTAGLVIGIIGLVLSAIFFFSCGLCQICVLLGLAAVA